jgi:hypothetical protein
MKNIKPDWRSAVSREFHPGSAATLDKIGTQLRFKLAKIIAEPLPVELQELVRDLEHKLEER